MDSKRSQLNLGLLLAVCASPIDFFAENEFKALAKKKELQEYF
jgi:hypothetical protein